MSHSKPKILVLGHARHGKDTVAEILRDVHGYNFISSSMFAVREFIYEVTSDSLDYTSHSECYEDRVNHRELWYMLIKMYNIKDKACLARKVVDNYDIYVGMRDYSEYRASAQMFDYILWVDSTGRGIPKEPVSSFTIPYDDEKMILIDNCGTEEDLYKVVASAVKEIESEYYGTRS